ncbi:MAG: DUF2330 domain-containing protein, partial [Pseudomonadota bacterium]|nr:DUF2330 domain-containing protein [Pseudomonadota bacterium]
STELFNESSKVVLMRDQDRTVITMASDYQGEPEDFALVVPVPTVLEREQIHVTENAIIDHLDAYTAPRLVEYFDDDPCNMRIMMEMRADAVGVQSKNSAKALGVTIEAQYQVGEYDILILDAKQSEGLLTWLIQNDYKVPKKAKSVLKSYIKQDMKFFVARVNLDALESSGRQYLRPIQIAYESPRFMLPIRLGTINAQGDQDMFVFGLTRKGRIEPINYQTKKIPSNMEIPLYIKDEFTEFYQAMFDQQVKQHPDSVFLEYAWDMGWCDPCAADPLSAQELNELGVYWIKKPKKPSGPQTSVIRPMPPQNAHDVFVTRLHVRYNAETFPEDILFQVTEDRQNYQGRYILRHPYEGPIDCDTEYQANHRDALEQQAKQLASLTGWSIDEIRAKMPELNNQGEPEPLNWWQRLWSW